MLFLFVVEFDRAFASGLFHDVTVSGAHRFASNLEGECSVQRSLDLNTAGSTSDGAACVECSHCELCSRFTDGLRGDDADCFAHVYLALRCHREAVALLANAVLAFACKW